MPTPAQWTNAFNPAFSYYVYYCYANLYVLNKVPFLLISSATSLVLSKLCISCNIFSASRVKRHDYHHATATLWGGTLFLLLCYSFHFYAQWIFKMFTNFRLVTLTTWLLRFSHAIASLMESIYESLLCFSISTTSPRFAETAFLYYTCIIVSGPKNILLDFLFDRLVWPCLH